MSIIIISQFPDLLELQDCGRLAQKEENGTQVKKLFAYLTKSDVHSGRTLALLSQGQGFESSYNDLLKYKVLINI
jgi:hypothetical protein